MKKLFVFILLTAATLAFFTACEETKPGSEISDDTPVEAYFVRGAYQPTETNLTLFLNGQAIGQLPFRNGRMACENDTLKQNALFYPLKEGKYLLEAKDQYGTVKANSDFTLTSSTVGGRCTIGNIRMVKQTNSCLLVEMEEF